MADLFPTKYELRCAGISLIVSHLLLCGGWALGSLKYDIYDVKNDEDIIRLHNALSNPTYKIKTELSVTCVWISFPLLLIGLYGLKKSSLIWFKSTPGEMYVYLFEKAYIIWITILLVIIPALALAIVSHDWSFDKPYSSESKSSSVSVPTGYYIQLFILILQFEIIDCVAVADAVFMLSLWILGLILMRGAYSKQSDPINQTFKDYQNEMEVANRPIISKCIGCCCVISSLIIFLILLFEFGDSGFFSITGYAKFLLIWIFICKMIIGAQLIYSSTNNKYSALKKIYEN
eukprot:57854_1